MEKDTKHFDRKIEQMMNEHTVAPPFGMWNRIATEVASEALPVAAAAPAAFMPKRSLVGFVAGVAVIGASLITAYLVGRNNAAPQQPLTQITNPVVVSAPVQQNESAAVVMEQVKEVTAPKANVVKAVAMVKKADKTEIATETTLPVSYTEISAPIQTMAANAEGAGKSYSFPAVDVITAEKPVTEEIATVTFSQLVKQEADENLVERRSRNSSSSSNDRKIKLRKHRSGFTYGSLNRLGKHKSN